jgi:hypothetical protein
MDGYGAGMEKTRNAYKILIGKPEERLRRRHEDNIKMVLKQIEYCGLNCIQLVQW